MSTVSTRPSNGLVGEPFAVLEEDSKVRRSARKREQNLRDYKKLKAKGYFKRYYHEARKPKLALTGNRRRPSLERDFLFVASRPVGAQRKNVFRMLYKISLDQYESLLATQGYSCKACGTSDPGGPYKRFVVDHNHSTMEIRGLTCFSCNVAIGHVRDDATRLRALANYLEGNV